MNKLDKAFAKLQFTSKMRVGLYKKLQMFLKEGRTLDQILRTLSVEYKLLKKSDVRAAALSDWLEEIEKGRMLSEAVSYWVPPNDIMMIRAGEASGDLASAFENIIETTESSMKMKSTVQKSLAYPILLITMLFGIIYLFSTQGVPQLVESIPIEEWPDSTKPLYYLSMFVTDYWRMVLIGLFATIYIVNISMKNLCGPIRDSFFDFLPPWSLYKTYQGSVFLISASAMLRSGISMYEAYDGLSKLSSRYVSRHIDKITKNMNSGMSNSDALKTGFLDKETAVDLAVFSTGNNFQDAMDAIGRTSIQNSVNKITAITGVINTIAMVCVAGFIAWVYYSFYTLSNSVGA